MHAGVISRITDLPREQWNRVAGTHHPFLRHEFLAALESHQCVGETFGWLPRHIVVQDDGGNLLGAAPFYLKDNSYGEFVFDWSWADAWQRAGKAYYPKLVSAIPYTPVTGPRLMVRAGSDAVQVSEALLRQVLKLAEQAGCSSLHWLFTDPHDTAVLLEHGYLRRTGCHFHWHNDGYRSFDDFLSRLRSRKRKKIRREREFVAQAGIRMEVIHGNEASQAQWEIMHYFYRSTFEKKLGVPTLSLEFFLDISRTMGEQVVLVFAWLGEQAVAGAINLRSDTALYGRHWGCLGKYNSLHFETCYYQGIEYCINHRLALFEPGAQGEHKISRGFLPTLTWSAHRIREPLFREPVAQFLADEHEWMLAYFDEMQGYSPYREDGVSHREAKR
jgi:predicted N-acyltransferase